MNNVREFHRNDIFNYSEIMKTLIQKFRNGDHVNDYELKQLLNHYMQLEKHLFAEGPHFYHAWKDVTDQVRRLIDMQNTRKK